MSIEAIRFRAAEAGVILQVLEREEREHGTYYGTARGTWRDAKVEDLLEVARYTRAHDALDSNIQMLQQRVEMVEAQVQQDKGERFGQFLG